MALLDLENQLIAHLRTALDDLGQTQVAVRPMREIGDIARTPLPCPAVLVSYGGAKVAGERAPRPDGKIARITQTWLVVVVVRNIANASDSDATAEAGALADHCLGELMGFRPTNVSAPLTLSDLPPPGFASGYYWLPLEFATELVRDARPKPPL